MATVQHRREHEAIQESVSFYNKSALRFPNQQYFYCLQNILFQEARKNNNVLQQLQRLLMRRCDVADL